MLYTDTNQHFFYYADLFWCTHWSIHAILNGINLYELKAHYIVIISGIQRNCGHMECNLTLNLQEI